MPTTHRVSVNVLLSNITFFVIFAILDVLVAVNSVSKLQFFTLIFAVLLHFLAVTWYRLRGAQNI